VLAGLALGAIVAALVLGGVVAFLPQPAAPTTPPIAIATSAPSPSIVPNPSVRSDPPSARPPASGAPSGSPVLVHVGDAAPALSVPQVGGGTIDLASLKGQPVWLTFVTTSCPSCRDEFPLMNSFANRYAANGLTVIAIDVGEDEGAAVALAEGLGATFPFGLDADGSAAQTWGATSLPVHFWIDKDGIIRDGAVGDVGADYMVQALEKIMPGVTVTT
jgi:peroxiredoxin